MTENTSTELKSWAVRVTTPPLSPDGKDMIQIYYVAHATPEDAGQVLVEKFGSSTIDVVKEVPMEAMAQTLRRAPVAGDCINAFWP